MFLVMFLGGRAAAAERVTTAAASLGGQNAHFCLSASWGFIPLWSPHFHQQPDRGSVNTAPFP